MIKNNLFESFKSLVKLQEMDAAAKLLKDSNAVRGTSWVTLFDTEKDISHIEGTFVYRKFEPFEQIDEGLIYTPPWAFDKFGDPINSWETMENLPRYVQFSWNSESNADLIPVTLSELFQGEDIFFYSDLLETYSLLQTDELFELRRQEEKISDNTSVAAKLDYLLGQVSSNEYTENVEAAITSSAVKIPVINPSTNRPIEEVTIQNRLQPPDIVLNSSLTKYIIDAANKSAIISNKHERSVDFSKQIASKYKSVDRKFSTFKTIMEDENKTKNCKVVSGELKSLFSKNWQLIGYVISKYRIETTGKTYLYSRITQKRNFWDPYVAYGQSYRYEIRPVYAKKNLINNKLFITASNESSFIDIDCVENRLPEPPESVKFEYVLNNKIEVSWKRPYSYIEDRGKLWEIDDIKGYQIFVRNDLRDPYRLLKYFTFNNTTPKDYRIRAKEFIPEDYIISYETPVPPRTNYWGAPIYYEPTRHILEIRPNVNYYFTLCSVDAHGNTSNYGTQYKIRRNNVTGEVEVKLLCGKGAPKQYPNAFIPGKLVTSSMTVSGYQNMDIYYCPDTQLSSPNENKEAVSIQLFELETQIEKNIKITIDTNDN